MSCFILCRWNLLKLLIAGKILVSHLHGIFQSYPVLQTSYSSWDSLQSVQGRHKYLNTTVIPEQGTAVLTMHFHA